MMASTTTLKTPDNLAFTLHLVAYDFNFPDRVRNQNLAVRKFSKRQDLAQHLTEHPSSVPVLNPSDEETSLNGREHVGVWCGMRLSSQSTANSRRGGSVNSVSRTTGFSPVPYDPTALRVLAPIAKKTAVYYALVDQKDGLCIGYHVPIREILFFPEYRDDTLAVYGERKQDWAKRVRVAGMVWQQETQIQSDPERLMVSSVIAKLRLSKSLVMKAKEVWESSQSDSSMRMPGKEEKFAKYGFVAPKRSCTNDLQSSVGQGTIAQLDLQIASMDKQIGDLVKLEQELLDDEDKEIEGDEDDDEGNTGSEDSDE